MYLRTSSWYTLVWAVGRAELLCYISNQPYQTLPFLAWSVSLIMNLGLITDVANIVIDGVSVLQNRQYSSDLADSSTQQYQSLEQEFCNEVRFLSFHTVHF